MGVNQAKSFCPARKNPFASEHLAKIQYHLSGATDNASEFVIELLEKFEELGKRAAIVAPEGHGKTTLQKKLASSMESVQTHWIRLRQGDRKIPQAILDKVFSAAKQEDVICVDGAEQLSWWNWKKFLRQLGKKQGCLITSHRKGLLPTLICCETSVLLLVEIVTELTSAPNFSQLKELEELFNKHRGDIRQCLRELYDWCSQGRWGVTNSETLI